MSSFFLDQATSQRYFVGIPFTHGDMHYTSSGATAETFADLGFKEVQVQPRPDDRFYIINSNPLDDGSWDATPRDLDQLKQAAIAQDKTTAGQLLSGSDWMVIRKDEIGTAVPPEWEAYRADVRSTCNTREGELLAVKTVEELAGLQLSEWPVDPRADKGIEKKASPGRTRG